MSEKKIRVGIYLRLSNEDKNKINEEDDSESIKNQRNMIIQYVNKYPNLVIVDEYCDEDLSGAGTYRPEFERLIKDCENRKLDIVLCKSQSRFSRDMQIVEKYINNMFKEWNIRFIGLCDNADTQIMGNKKARQINGLVNEWYLEDISNNIRSAFNSKMKQGEFISPFAPFGYEIDKNNNNKLIIDPIACNIVKNIYYLYLKGLGFTSIAKYLNSKNIPCPSLYKYQKGIKLNVISNRPREEIKWNANAIKTILTNEVYLGHLVQGKRTTISYKNHKIIKKDKKEWIKTINTHEAIIDEEIFNKVQIAIKERTKPLNKTGFVHIFSGKVFCLECNHYMRKKNTKRHEYLVCSNNRDGYNNCENKYSIRYDKLAKIVLDAINNKITKYYDEKELVNLYLNSINNKYINTIYFLEKQIIDIQNKISKNNNYIKNIYEDKVNDIITIEQFKYLLSIYSKNKETYIKQIKSINNEIDYYKNKEHYINNKDILKKYQRLKELNKIIVDEFIDKIYIEKINKENTSRNIYIKWNFKYYN